MRRCRRGDRGRQTEGRFRSMLLQPRGERGWHSRRRKVLLARRHADACEILPRQEEECAGFLILPKLARRIAAPTRYGSDSANCAGPW